MSRNFIFRPRSEQSFRFPTDLLGITTLSFDEHAENGDFRQTLGPLCNKVRRAIRQLGPRSADKLVFDQVAALPYRKRDKGVEFFLLRTTSSRWAFPKSNAVKSEDPWRTAEAAAYDEGGLLGSVQKQPIAIFRHKKFGSNKELLVAAYIFAVDESKTRLPRRREFKWVKAEEIDKFVADGRDIEYMKEMVSVVQRAMDEI
jgi:hypothetical protein